MPAAPPPPAAPRHWFVELLGGGAAGVGLVLVLLPTLAVIYGAVSFKGSMIVGLPVLAILGIMILLGTLSLVAMLFKQLELTDPKQPLALPPGSMRATIALALIVLFAIFSITLYLSISNAGVPYTVAGLREAERNALVLATPSRVIVAEEDDCATAAKDACPKDDRRYKVTLRAASSTEGIDFAKQLLVLVGTLMTSVTSYYFATRAGSETDKTASPDATSQRTAGSPVSPAPAPDAAPAAAPAAATTPAAAPAAAGPVAAPVEPHAHAHDPDDADGCDVAILDATADEHLPPAMGGVAPKEA
jgi:hypothetical protein